MLLKQELEFHGMLDVIKVISSDYLKPKKEVKKHRALVGEPGTRIIGIEAMKPVEKGVLHFVLCRPWELESKVQRGEIYEPIQSLKISVIIK